MLLAVVWQRQEGHQQGSSSHKQWISTAKTFLASQSPILILMKAENKSRRAERNVGKVNEEECLGVCGSESSFFKFSQSFIDQALQSTKTGVRVGRWRHNYHSAFQHWLQIKINWELFKNLMWYLGTLYTISFWIFRSGRAGLSILIPPAWGLEVQFKNRAYI